MMIGSGSGGEEIDCLSHHRSMSWGGKEHRWRGKPMRHHPAGTRTTGGGDLKTRLHGPVLAFLCV